MTSSSRQGADSPPEPDRDDAALSQTSDMQPNSSFTPLDRRAATSNSLFMAISATELPAASRQDAAPRVPVRHYFAEVPEPRADRKRWADVLERNVGEFRIYAGALDAAEGGYTAAVDVQRVRGRSGSPEIIYSSDRISGDHRFEDTASALRYALDIGHQAIRLRKSLPASTPPADR